MQQMNWLDRFALAISPQWGQNRIRARVVAQELARHYEAAAGGRRTANWRSVAADANVAAGGSLALLRGHARDLVRNNSWATKGLRVITTNTVGWGISAKADTPELTSLWRAWAERTHCDADGLLNFYGLEALVLRTVVESGEVLVRRRISRNVPKSIVPLKLQVLEPDFIDTTKDGLTGDNGGPIIQGVEYDRDGVRVAYWLFDRHPGSAQPGSLTSRRVDAKDILHIFVILRPGQVRGITWFAPVIVNLKDFDEYEDAKLMQQKIAACFSAFVTDIDGTGTAVGEQSEADPLIETLEPGMISYLRPGQSVEFATPPVTGDIGFSVQMLRKAAAGLGVPYEMLTGDYSQVNFSSARMSRLDFWGNIHDWRWNMLVPRLCDPVWDWFCETAEIAGFIAAPSLASWTAPPAPMLEPDKEGVALRKLVRSGAMTHDEMVRERGYDPETHWEEYAEGLKRLDKLGIVLDSDPRKTSDAGLMQERAGAGGGTKTEKPAEDSDE